MENIVYSDEYIEVYHSPGSYDCTLITFSEMGMGPGQGAWGGVVLKKLDIPYIGFVSKTPNWFPEQSIKDALRSVLALIDNNHSVITYGFSQGAYAAIRYAKLFGADAILSFAPQYSINPQAMGGVDRRFSAYHRDDHNHRAVQNSDIPEGCLAILFYDPWDHLDNINANHIIQEVGGISTVKIYGTGHQIIRCFSSSKVLSNLIELVTNNDIAGVKNLAISAKKSWNNRLEFLIRAMSRINLARSIKFIENFSYDFNTEAADDTLTAIYDAGELGFFVRNKDKLPNTSLVEFYYFHSLLYSNEFNQAKSFLLQVLDKNNKRAFWKSLDIYTNAAGAFVNEELAIEYGIEKTDSKKVVFGIGWHEPEAWGAWSSSLSSTLYVTNDSFAAFMLSGHISRSFPDQRVRIFASVAGQEHEVPVFGDNFSIPYLGAVTLKFVVDRLNKSGDTRLLGVGARFEKHAPCSSLATSS